MSHLIKIYAVCKFGYFCLWCLERYNLSLYRDIDALSSSCRSTKQKSFLVFDEQAHEGRVSDCVHCWYNDLVEHGIFGYCCCIFELLSPGYPFPCSLKV